MSWGDFTTNTPAPPVPALHDGGHGMGMGMAPALGGGAFGLGGGMDQPFPTKDPNYAPPLGPHPNGMYQHHQQYPPHQQSYYGAPPASSYPPPPGTMPPSSMNGYPPHQHPPTSTLPTMNGSHPGAYPPPSSSPSSPPSHMNGSGASPYSQATSSSTNMYSGSHTGGVDPYATTVVRPRDNEEKRMQSSYSPTEQKDLEAGRMKIYLKLRELTERHNVNLQTIRIVIIGGESSGKSSLLQAFLQFPASFCQDGTGTRCPVEYTLIYNASVTGELPRVYVNDGQSSNSAVSEINAQELEKWVQGQMVRVQTNGGFSEVAIKVRLEWSRYRPIQVLDCPGLVAGRHYQIVENITRTWARRPDTLLVCTIGSKDNQTQLTHVQTINRLMTDQYSTLPPRHDWKQHVQFVCTFFDNFMTQMFTPSAANNGFAEKQGMNPVYCCLAPWIVHRDEFSTKSFLEKTKMIQSAPDIERQLLDDYFGRLRSDPVWRLENERAVGIPVVLDTIYSRWAHAIDAQLPKVRIRLQELVEAAIAKAKSAKGLAQPVEDFTMLQCMLDYAATAVKAMQRYIKASPEDEQLFPVATCGQTFWQEMDGVKKWMDDTKQEPTSIWKPLEELKFETFCDKTKTNEDGRGLLRYLSIQLRGGQQIERLLCVFEYLIRITPFPTFTESEIRTWSGFLAGSKTSQLQTENAVRAMVMHAIQNIFNPGCDWFECHLRYLYHSWLKNTNTGLTATSTKAARRNPLTSLRSSILDVPSVELPSHFKTNLIQHYEVITSQAIDDSLTLYRRIQTFEQFMIQSDQSSVMHSYVNDIKVKSITTVPKDSKDPKGGTTTTSSDSVDHIIKGHPKPSSRVFEAEPPSVTRVLNGIAGNGEFLKRDRHRLKSKGAYIDAYKSAIEIYDGTIGRLMFNLKGIFIANVHMALQEESAEALKQLRSVCFEEAKMEQKVRLATIEQRRRDADAAERALEAMIQARDDADACIHMFHSNRKEIKPPNLDFLGNEVKSGATATAAAPAKAPAQPEPNGNHAGNPPPPPQDQQPVSAASSGS